MKLFKRWALILLILTILGVVGLFLVGSLIVAPQNREVGQPPAGFAFEKVIFASGSGTTIHGWWQGMPNSKGSVLLLHGIRANRTSMVGRAKFLSKAGYDVLMIDLQAHGESIGKQITLGKLESLDVAAALNYLGEKSPDLPIAVLGSSLGGASAILCESDVEVKAMIVEAVFPSVERATSNRLEIRLGKAGKVLAPLLTQQIPWRLKCESSEIRPLEQIEHVKSPILIINGSADRRTTPEESRALFERANEPKELWIIDSAGHVDLHRFAKLDYENRILAFLELNL